MSDVKLAFAEFYKKERNRSEECLGDIVKILDEADTTEADQVDRILARLVEHYNR